MYQSLMCTHFYLCRAVIEHLDERDDDKKLRDNLTEDCCGEDGLVRAMVPYTDIIQSVVYSSPNQNFPGVFDYELSEASLGKRFVEMCEESQSLPDLEHWRVEAKSIIDEWFQSEGAVKPKFLVK